LLTTVDATLLLSASSDEFGGWQRLNAEYAKQFGIESPRLAAQRPEALTGGRNNPMERRA